MKKKNKFRIFLVLLMLIVILSQCIRVFGAGDNENDEDNPEDHYNELYQGGNFWFDKLVDGTVDGMDPDTLANALEAMRKGSKATWTSETASKYLYTKEDGTKVYSDYLFIKDYNNTYCADPPAGHGLGGKMQVLGVFEMSGGKTNLYTRNGDIMGMTDSYFNELAYVAGNKDSKSWHQMQSYVNFMRDYIGNTNSQVKELLPELTGYKSSGNPDAIGDLYQDSMDYANSVKQLNDGKGMTGGTTEGAPNSEGKMGPFSFDKFGVTGGTVNATVTLSDGSTVNSFNLVTPNGTVACDSSTNLGDILQAGDEFYFDLGDLQISPGGNCGCPPDCPQCSCCNSSDGSALTVKDISITYTYSTWDAIMIFIGSPSLNSQARVYIDSKEVPHTETVHLTPGECKCETTPPPPPPEIQDTPMIKVEKKDVSGADLAGVTLQVTIDDSYSETKTTGEDWIIDFKDVLDADNKLKAQLKDVDKNNASKLFTQEYFDPGFKRIELTDTGIKDYVKELTTGTMLEALNRNATYNLFKQLVQNNKTGHDAYIQAQRAKNSLRIPNSNASQQEWQYYYNALSSYQETINKNTDAYNIYEDATVAIKEAEDWAVAFADTYPKNTDMLKEWLEARVITSGALGEYKEFKTTINKVEYTIKGTELEPKFEHAAYEFYENCPEAVMPIDLLRILTGEVKVKITELSTLPGYVLWAHEQTKTITIKYKDGDVENPLDIYSNAFETYEAHSNDQVEVEHKGTKDDPSDGTYDVTELICYNEEDKIVFDFQKYAELTSMKGTLQSSFTIELTATEVFWDGPNPLPTLTLNTSSGHASCKFSELGIDVISRWSGTIDIKITENSTDEHYIQWVRPKTIRVTYEWGKITSIQEQEGTGEDAIVESGEGGITIYVNAYNTPKDAPQIVVQKNDFAGSALKGAVFNATVTSSTGGSVQLSNLTTNDAGEIIIYAEDLEPLQIDVINRWTGTLTVTLRETKAPQGYKLIDHDIVVTITYSNGIITSLTCSDPDVECKPYDTTYTDNAGREGEAPSGTVTIKDRLDNKLRIRKVDGDTLNQEFLDGASFRVTITADGKTQTITETVDNQGYIDLTDTVNSMIGELGSYTGTINVVMEELSNPNGFIQIPRTLEVTLTYVHGYMTEVKYENGDNLSEAVLDVGVSEDKTKVTIAVKNTRNELQPIYISKIDSVTGTTLSNVDFKIVVAREEITNDMDMTIYKTDDDGLITIDKATLEKVGLTDYYTGDLYILMEELGNKPGYKPLDGEIYIKVTYNNGNIVKAEVLRGKAECILADEKGAMVLKVNVENEWEIPDLKIIKESLTNGHDQIVNTAQLSITVSANGASTSKSTLVDSSGQIIFDTKELEKALGIDGTFTGEMTIVIEENYVDATAVVIPGTITAKLKFENGRFIEGEVDNVVHASIINKDDEVIIKVLDSIEENETMILAGTVWEELAWNKDGGLLKDGKYTTDSESEVTDRLFEGIEVTLYRTSGDTLSFVNVSKGTNPTFTDSKGHYEFEVPVGNDYVVMFTYNGQTFEATASENINPLVDMDEWKLTSKGSEFNGRVSSEGTRYYVNDLLKEIGSYPANYKVRNLIFTNHADKFEAEDGVYYNTAYRYDELEDVYKAIVTEMKAFLAKQNNLNDATSDRIVVYENVVKNHYTDANGELTDKEIYNKLQYIYDSRVSAYAGYYTAKNGINDMTGIGTYKYPGSNSVDYEEQKYINLALVKRDATDLTLKKDLMESVVSINGHDEKYTFNKNKGPYDQYIYEEDYNYVTTQTPGVPEKSNGIAYYVDEQIQVYLKYKITVKNTTGVDTRLTEVVDYFDSRFGYKDSYQTTAGRTIAGLEVNLLNANGSQNKSVNASVEVGSKYADLSEIGLDKIAGFESEYDYSQLFIRFAEGDEPVLENGNYVEIYLTLKLGQTETEKIATAYRSSRGESTAQNILKDYLTNNGILDAFNYAEVNGYKTENGLLDRNSKPGTFNVYDYEKAKEEHSNAIDHGTADDLADALAHIERSRQDDAWGIEIDISNNLVSKNDNTYYHRTMTGNVWEAITNEVHTSADLYNNKLLTYARENGIKGIVVELVELKPDGRDIVRARTVTGEGGEYSFSRYIPGEYAVRFVYGSTGKEGLTEAGQSEAVIDTSMKVNSEGNANGDKFYGINGQYYQSTKANPDTDKVTYWYAKYTGDAENPTYEASTNPGVVGDKNTDRYSDAYDGVKSRINQIEARTKGDAASVVNDSTGRANIDSSWSWNYEWDGVESVQTDNETKHVDQMEAYTSTMEIEVEYTKKEVTGDKDYDYYRYEVEGVDFGLTPRAEADMLIENYVSNVKIYLQDGTKQLDIDLDKNKNIIRVNNDKAYQNIVIPHEETESYKDGYLEVNMDSQLLNGATVELTYTTTVTNTGKANTITYFYTTDDVDNPIALAYYYNNGEELTNMTYYEKNRNSGGNPIVCHNTNDRTYSVVNCDTGNTMTVDVRTRATNIVDFIDENLNFTAQDHEKQEINGDWELVERDNYNSTRETNTTEMEKLNNVIRAKGGNTVSSYLEYLAKYRRGEAGTIEDGSSVLYTPLLPGESRSTNLVLTKYLEQSSTETNEYEFENFMELVKLENYAGKAIRMEGYNINGKQTSKLIDEDSTDPNWPKKVSEVAEPYYETLGSSKPMTLVIHPPTGLSASEEALSNLWIVLVSLAVLAGGIVLIKKFVIKPKE